MEVTHTPKARAPNEDLRNNYNDLLTLMFVTVRGRTLIGSQHYLVRILADIPLRNQE